MENPKVEVSNWTSRLRSDSPICDFDFWIFHCRTFHFPIPLSHELSQGCYFLPKGEGYTPNLIDVAAYCNIFVSSADRSMLLLRLKSLSSGSQESEV